MLLDTIQRFATFSEIYLEAVNGLRHEAAANDRSTDGDRDLHIADQA